MATQQDERRQDFRNLCEQLTNNDPSVTHVSLVDSVRHDETPLEQDRGATNVLQAVSHNKNVISLRVDGMVYRKPEILQYVLSSTQTLAEFEFKWVEDSHLSSEVSQSLRRGLQKNTTLETAKFTLGRGPQVPVVLSSLVSLLTLRKLTLNFVVNDASAEALRFFLVGNDTLESLCLSPLSCSTDEASYALEALLLGLAVNRGLKDFYLGGNILEESSMYYCSTALAEMFESNSTLEVFGAGGKISCTFSSAGASAIARGLVTNTSLRTLRLDNTWPSGAFHGPTWRNALEKNNTLRDLDLSWCNIGTCSDFASFTQGLACNKSLKVLKLRENTIANSQALVLVNALQTNACLETLNLAWNAIEGPDGATTVRGLWSKKNLLHLNLSFNRFGGGDASATVFSEGLPKNETLQTLDISDCSMNSSDFCVVVNSFCGSNALQTLEVGNNRNISVDGRAAAALKELLLSSSLEELFIRETKFTRAGMVEVAAGLCENSSLRELCVAGHSEMDLETLAPLCEALQVNSTLKSLDIDGVGFDTEDLRRFFGLLPRMKGIETLAIHLEDLDVAGEKAVLDGFRLNTSLESLSNLYQCVLSDDMRKSIEFYLEMNRNGRKYLQEDDKAKDKTEQESEDASNNARADMPHIAAWPRILAKMTSRGEQDQLFFFLRRKTDLFQGPPQSRKRKACDSGLAETA